MDFPYAVWKEEQRDDEEQWQAEPERGLYDYDSDAASRRCHRLTETAIG